MRFGGVAGSAAVFWVSCCVLPSALWAASFRTANFQVTAASAEWAQAIAESAEYYRKKHAVDWTGSELKPWPAPCPVNVTEGSVLLRGKKEPFYGETEYRIQNGYILNLNIRVWGSLDRLLDTVIPHEVLHAVFVCHFRARVPRWASEGAAVAATPNAEERRLFEKALVTYLKTDRGIPFDQLFSFTTTFPKDVLALYAQGYSLTRFLLLRGGKRKFMSYLADGLRTHDWSEVTRQHYGFDGLGDLQAAWLEWVVRGSPRSTIRAGAAAKEAIR